MKLQINSDGALTRAASRLRRSRITEGDFHVAPTWDELGVNFVFSLRSRPRLGGLGEGSSDVLPLRRDGGNKALQDRTARIHR
jgi:hypothetical protein